MERFQNFKTKTISQIRLWAWAAAVLPVTALIGILFVWRFFDGTVLGYAMIIGESAMFGVAVFWWWWAMYVLRNLVRHWEETRENVKTVADDIKGIREIVLEVMSKDK